MFRSEKNSGCYGNLLFLQTYNGKSGNRQFLSSHLGIFDFVYILSVEGAYFIDCKFPCHIFLFIHFASFKFLNFALKHRLCVLVRIYSIFVRYVNSHFIDL